MNEEINENVSEEYSIGEAVDLYIDRKTPLGYGVYINGVDEATLFDAEVFQLIEEGDKVQGYIKAIREDGLYDLTLTPPGFRNSIDGHNQAVLRYLVNKEGFIPLNDKSNPELIKKEVGMSKKAFKRAIGNLYKLRMIRIETDGLYLVKKS